MRRLAPSGLAIVSAACLLAGCGAARMDQPHVPFSAAPIAGAVESTYDIPIDAMEEVMRFAMWELHWGPMKIDQQSQGLTASAVRPNGRTVTVHAQVNSEGLVDVQVVAGRFGDERVERDFHRELSAAVERWRQRQTRS